MNNTTIEVALLHLSLEVVRDCLALRGKFYKIMENKVLE